jgi:hypothetical protein
MVTHSGVFSKITWNYALHHCEKKKIGNRNHAISGTNFNQMDQTLETLIAYGAWPVTTL